MTQDCHVYDTTYGIIPISLAEYETITAWMSIDNGLLVRRLKKRRRKHKLMLFRGVRKGRSDFGI